MAGGPTNSRPSTLGLTVFDVTTATAPWTGLTNRVAHDIISLIARRSVQQRLCSVNKPRSLSNKHTARIRWKKDSRRRKEEEVSMIAVVVIICVVQHSSTVFSHTPPRAIIFGRFDTSPSSLSHGIENGNFNVIADPKHDASPVHQRHTRCL